MDTTESSSVYPFQRPGLPLPARVDDLVSRLTLEEKISLLHQYQPAIPRLGIAPFRTGTEALHGVAWQGVATVFPQAIGLASTWNPALVKQVGAAVGDEVRGFHFKDRDRCGLNVWAPVVDLLRDPRAGRNEEGYSEDPFLTGQMSMAYAGGLQGDDPFYLKTAPSLKHFFAYNHEHNRDLSDSIVDPRNLNEYYLKAFQPAIEAGKAAGVMTSYNFVNGRPTTVTPALNAVVRQWTSEPLLVVSDAVAPSNLVRSQKYYPTHPEAHAAALKAGVDSFTDRDTDPTFTIESVTSAFNQGLLTQADIDSAVRHIFSIRIRLGEFDPGNPYAGLTDSTLHAPAHQVLAHEAARQQFVLLKNEGSLLPLKKGALTHLAVIGQRANQVLTDWYSGTLPYTFTPLDAIQAQAGAGVTVGYALDNTGGAAVHLARSADAAIVVVGNHPTCNAGWAQCEEPTEGKETVDRRSIDLPAESLIREIYAANPRTIVVLISSFPYAINWTQENVPAILWSSHAGQALGAALAEVLFGDAAPAGRLTQTWYASLDDLPDLLDYDIINGRRTYQYFAGAPLYPFGHGLTYTTFDYDNLKLSAGTLTAADLLTVSLDVTNRGSSDSDEVVQLYVHARRSRVKQPIKALKGFSRVNIAAGQTATIRFDLPVSELAFWDVTRDRWAVESGLYDILIGRSSADIRLAAVLTVQADSIPPRDLSLPTRAVNYDDSCGVRLVDETPSDGTAVGAAAAGNWIAFKNVDFGRGVGSFVARLSNAGPDPLGLEIRLDSPGGPLAGTVAASSTPGVYDWLTCTGPVTGVMGIHDVYLVFGGALRLATFHFER
jgi:beta-glucosidase